MLVIAGLILMVLAVWQMWRHKTTVIPHLDPDALVTSGIFNVTRNPIYLGDLLVLLGLILRWNAHAVTFVLLPLFVWIIARRFIQPEEQRLYTAFGSDFETYCLKTRRWI
jgi:protein-S-isoprenylcysteine O-methyltransferase Ste14